MLLAHKNYILPYSIPPININKLMTIKLSLLLVLKSILIFWSFNLIFYVMWLSFHNLKMIDLFSFQKADVKVQFDPLTTFVNFCKIPPINLSFGKLGWETQMFLIKNFDPWMVPQNCLLCPIFLNLDQGVTPWTDILKKRI